MTFGMELAVIGLMLILNAIFAAYEMALASESQARLALLAEQKKAGALSALYMKERIEGSLAVIQVGITLVGAVAAATGGTGIDQTLTPFLMKTAGLSARTAEVLALIAFVLPLSAVTIVFGELIPKVFAIENREWVVLTLSPAMRWLFRLTAPVIAVFERIVKAVVRLTHRGHPRLIEGETAAFFDLRAAVSLARTKRIMGAQEERIVLSAALLSKRPIQDIALPASEISMIPSRLPLAEGLVRAHLDLHTRFPISAVENDPQTIEGYITFKDLVTALKMHATTPTVKGIARPVKRIPVDTPISQVLELMIRERLHIALVVSKEDRVRGLVTLEDIIEELVGDIEDEADSLPAHMHPTSGGWIVGGSVPMNAVASRLGVPWSQRFANPNILHLNDWCELVLGRDIGKGDVIRSDGLQVTVRKIRRRKLAEAFVSKMLS